MAYFSDPKEEMKAALQEAVEVLEGLIETHDVYHTYLRLKEALEQSPLLTPTVVAKEK